MHPLERYRQDKGLTQPDLAKKLSVTNGYISLLENGLRKPSPVLAKKIERILGIPRAQLRPDLWA